MTRPIAHFSPSRNWMNDPNGLLFHNGRYHLFFQHNPLGLEHANLSWGHASSPDLVHWDEHPVAISHDEHEVIFSGSAVVDSANTAGFAAPGETALVAIYTSVSVASPHVQSQSLAYSVDDGVTWTKYERNPVLDRGSLDFRDPKVFRYEGAAGAYWVMVAVEAQDRQVLLYRSDDLIRWTFLSSFGPERAVGGVWECPDLFPLAVDDDPAEVRWVLVISLNPGGVSGGSGTQYVIGDFDGVTFTADDAATGDQVDWLDFGRDCYAGVTFDGLADDDRTMIAWTSNWDYGRDLPFADGPLQHSMMTLPRRLSLVRMDGGIRLRQRAVTPPVADGDVVIADIAAGGPLAVDTTAFVVADELPEAGRLNVRVDTCAAPGFELRLRCGAGGQGGVRLSYDRDAREVRLDRTDSGDAVHEAFPSVERMPVVGERFVELVIWLDRGSVEVFADAGTRVLTDLLPARTGDALAVSGIGGQVLFETLTVAEVPAFASARASTDTSSAPAES